jgi:hypothetical protein
VQSPLLGRSSIRRCLASGVGVFWNLFCQKLGLDYGVSNMKSIHRDARVSHRENDLLRQFVYKLADGTKRVGHHFSFCKTPDLVSQFHFTCLTMAERCAAAHMLWRYYLGGHSPIGTSLLQERNMAQLIAS